MKKVLLFMAALIFFSINVWAQVTTSSLTGTVKSSDGEALIGATVKATHVPSGTVYGTVTQEDGHFTIPNMRIGGPYKIEISYIGYQTNTINNVNLTLGQPFLLTAKLGTGSQQLQGVTVVGEQKLNHERTGAATIVSTKELNTLPTISRSITDFTRLTPQANGNNFAGRDGRYNNLKVDGADLNNNFGLSSDLLPGGGSSPISLDAYDEIAVNIAPYDVRQSGFTGAGINAVTKSGTNTFHGTLYGFYRDQSFNGKKVDGETLTVSPQKHKTFGGSLGGPIIKDKLFFFINAEFEKSSQPGIEYAAAGSNTSGTPSSTPVDSLKALSDYLQSKYNYNTGAYENFPNFETKNHKILAKIDWNINRIHKLTLKYSDFKGSDESPLNGSSVPNNGSFLVSGQAKSLTRLPNNRFSSKSMSFANSNYGTDHVVQSATAELNSNFSNKVSNQLLLAYTHDDDKRTIPGGQVFPTIDIFDGNGQNQLTAGTDPFTNNNDVIDNILDITDNFTYYAGKHTITAGATYEHQRVGDEFMGGSNGHYIYNSLDDFLNDRAPVYFGYTYSLVPGKTAVYSANLKLSQAGVYLQDEYNVNSNLNITLGLRADMPIYGENPLENPAITALEFPDKDGNLTHYNTGEWPKNKILLSPRLGFHWDALGDKSLIVRGGTGVFTGKIPFVWLTNMPSNNGMYQASVYVNTPSQLQADGIDHFEPDPSAYQSNFPATPDDSKAPQSFVLIDPDFKFPQVFRTNLGVDKSLGNGFTASVDLMYTKDINAVKMRNVNLKAPDARLNGIDNRVYYTSSTSNSDKFNYYPNLGQEIILENTHKGYSYAATAQISKSFANGFYGSIAYTYTQAKEVSPNPGSRATSAWQSIVNVGTTNNVELGNSEYAIPHRVVADISYRIEYANHLATTISFYYQGMNQENYNFQYNGDLNGDGNGSDLMYIYKSGSDVPFAPVTNDDGSVKYSVEDQQNAYNQFVNSSPYLKNHKGEYASRYGALTPWFNQLDVRFLQDFFITTNGGTRHTLEFSLDMQDLPNLISSKWKNWGYRQMYTINNPLISKGIDANGTPQFQMNQYNGALATDAFAPNISSSSTWGMQLGLRYSF